MFCSNSTNICDHLNRLGLTRRCNMILAICLCLLYIHVYGTMASDTVSEIRVQHIARNVLRLSCRINNTKTSRSGTLSIFENIPNNTLVMVESGDCPIVQSSARAKDIYLPQCVPKEIQSLDILLMNYNPADDQGFGCNYTYLIKGFVRHSVSFVPIANNTSLGTVNQTNLTSTQQGNSEAIEDTLFVTTSTSTNERPDSDGSGFVYSHFLVAVIILSTLQVLLIVIYLIVKFTGLRRRSSSSKCIIVAPGEKELMNNKTNELEDDMFPYTEIKNTSKLNHEDQGTIMQPHHVICLNTVKGDEHYIYTKIKKPIQQEKLVDIAQKEILVPLE